MKVTDWALSDPNKTHKKEPGKTVTSKHNREKKGVWQNRYTLLKTVTSKHNREKKGVWQNRYTLLKTVTSKHNRGKEGVWQNRYTLLSLLLCKWYLSINKILFEQ